MIELGSKVKCKYTGVIGVAVVRAEFINGCVQYGVAQPVKKDGTLPEETAIDEKSLVVLAKPPKEKAKKERDGGPNTRGLCMRGY